jgi:hypothetical protein
MLKNYYSFPIRQRRDPRSGRVVSGGGGRNNHPAGRFARGGKRLGLTPFMYCVQCGTANDTRATAWSKDGEGISHEDDGTPSVDAGCAFCGSLFWQYQKPKKLRDDPKPSREARIRVKRW